ncbi:MAG: proton-conducting transporter membrane subunit [Campylobacterota bacterium]|nr:proton-conducting transporter membrane subunit [Campylobacterota bacterium]
MFNTIFSFGITPLGNLFFALTLIVFLSLFIVKNENRSIPLHILLLTSLGFIFYAKDFITFFIGWEVMGWCSYFIISQTAKRETLQKYIVFNIAGAFALLGAIVLIYGASGGFIYEKIDFNTISSSTTLAISILVLIAVFIKSGIVPFHHWIVDTYQESNHIFSTILSAIISKAGIFAFILIFGQIITFEKLNEILFLVVAWAGVITSIIATFKAISQDDMKRLLAYSSIAQIGYIITILAVLNSVAFEAALYHTIIHTFVKLLLFVNIAAIIYVTKQTKFSKLGGLLYTYPLQFVLLVIGIITLAGMPPLGGFSSKFLIYTTLLTQEKALLLVAVMFSSASAFLYCYKLVYGIYLGQKSSKVEYKKIPLSFYIPQVISAIVLVVLGMFPSLIVPLFNNVLSSISLETIQFIDIYTLTTPFASFNGFTVMSSFIVLFIIIFIVFISLKNKTVKTKDRYDISYCGEVPDENSNLHYGYSMGNELKRISFIKVILNNSSKYLWDKITNITKDISIVVKKLYSLDSQTVVLIGLIFFTVILYMGVK